MKEPFGDHHQRNTFGVEPIGPGQQVVADSDARIRQDRCGAWVWAAEGLAW